MKPESIDDILTMLLRGLVFLENDLKKKILVEKVSNDLRVKYLNTLKMYIYLTIEFSNYMEKRQQTSKDNDLLNSSTVKKGTKKTASKKTDSDISDWIDTRDKILDSISRITLLNIQKLWDPPIVEEQFVILITNLCYKLMENCQSNSLKPQQKKILKDHICHILGIMIKKYNHSYGACVMIMQTLPHYEHYSSIYADLIQTCVQQLSYESILPDILREFRHHTNNTSTNEKDNPNLKYYSQFLIDLSDRLAPNLLPYLSLIQDFLDDESYLMRNSIIYIYGEIIIKVLNQETTAKDLKLKQMRNELLDTLCEHIHDTNAIARSKTLQTWRRICDEKAMPLNYMNEVMKKCVGRMEDIASSVRKSAFQLLCDLIRKNPYGIVNIETSLNQIETEFIKEDGILKKLTENNDLNEDEEEEELNEDLDSTQTTNSEELKKQQDKEKQQQIILLQKSKVNYLKDTLEFIRQIESAIPKLSRLLFSKTQTDVLEVISFFVTCYEHGLTDMVFGIRKMLSLVLYAEKTIKDAVINAYKKLYLTNNNNSLLAAKQLIKLVQDLTICERDALEELIGEFALSGELDNSIIQILWEIFTNNDPQQSLNRLNALILLGMIIRKIPEKGRANITVLVDYGLNIVSEVATNSDMIRISETCHVFSLIGTDTNSRSLTQQETTTTDSKNKKNKKEQQTPKLQFNNEPFKLPNQHFLFTKLEEIIVQQFSNLKTNYWTQMVENALSCLFKLADNPMLLVEVIIEKLMLQIPIFKHLIKGQQSDEETMVKASILSRFFSMIGFVATKVLIFLNQSVVCELKRRKMCKESQQDLDQTKRLNKAASNASKKSMNRRKSVKFNQSSNDNLEEEMGLQGAEAEDAELMFIEALIDQKVAQHSLLAQLLPAIIHILKEPFKYSDETVQLSCSLALVKMMLLSPRICNQYLQLLFTLLEKSTNPLIRSQLIIGIGDLVYRFPNALEPWTSHLYLPLRDAKSPCVRMNTIRVLSHLILKEMIKTRGQIYEIALCTIDSDEKICTLAKAFFQELSMRNNGLVIYNAMPDIISQLSGGECSDDIKATQPTSKSSARKISEESFRIIVTFLFSFIKRDKQCETLIEKLCHAFRQANTSERKCRDLVFCLSKIQLGEGGVKKLKETFKWYADKLSIQAVYDTFKNVILKNARKITTIKSETKLLIDELEKQIEEVRQKGLGENNDAITDNNEDETADSEVNNDDEENIPPTKQPAVKKRAANVRAAASQKGNKSSNFKKRKGNKKVETSSESEDDISDSD